MPLVLNGATSGSTTVQATDAVTATLTLPSSTGTLLSTANPQSGGVIQVVNSTYTSYVTSSSTSLTDTGLTASITPKFSTSKIIILVTITGISWNATNATYTFAVTDGSNSILGYLVQWNTQSATTGNVSPGYSLNLQQTPATTATQTYKVRYNNSAGGIIRMNDYQVAGGTASSITLFEVAV